ncbi:MAG: hypothetical protein WB507_08085 [Solirubrobacterales bacterium]
MGVSAPASSVSGIRVRRAAPHRAPRHVAVDLTPEAVERIATRLDQLLQRQGRAQPELLSAGELARRLRVERPWVYRHRELLGGMRIGSGPKAPWRFDYETAVMAMRRQTTQHAGGGPAMASRQNPPYKEES